MRATKRETPKIQQEEAQMANVSRQAPPVQASAAASRRLRPKREKKDWNLLLFLLPGIVFLTFFRYAPMYGIVTAFQDYNIFKGISGSPWVGFKHFKVLFQSSDFKRVLLNTLRISAGKLLFTFPMSILLAILINEINQRLCKKVFQTVLYLPHFLSWVIVAGLMQTALSPSGGIVNQMIRSFGGDSISFFMDKGWFPVVVIGSEAWKEVGYQAIVFIAAITGISPDLYEASSLDGAGKLSQIIHITIPGILPTIVLMFILQLGSILNANTEQILLMYNPTVYETGDVLGTYVYRNGISAMKYSYATAVGLFESVVGFALVMLGNFTSRKISGRSAW